MVGRAMKRKSTVVVIKTPLQFSVAANASSSFLNEVRLKSWSKESTHNVLNKLISNYKDKLSANANLQKYIVASKQLS